MRPTTPFQAVTMPCIDELLPLSRRAVLAALAAARSARGTGPILVDCTAGNGHDTVFLAEAGGPSCRVWAFDIQEEALTRARERVAAAGVAERVSFLRAGHEAMAEVLPADLRGRITAAVFNLGFLPGSDKRRTTLAASTLQALETLKTWLAPQGLLSVHSYAGHPGGAEERAAVRRWFEGLAWPAWRVASYGFINKPNNPEELFLAQKQRRAA